MALIVGSLAAGVVLSKLWLGRTAKSRMHVCIRVAGVGAIFAASFAAAFGLLLLFNLVFCWIDGALSH
jgi:uncharacterized protein (DUF697 family)